MPEAVRLFGGLTGINTYVPGMTGSGSIIGKPIAYSLGTPAAPDNDGIDTDIDADATAGTETAQSWTSDAPYGRTLTMNMNADPGAAGGVYDVVGRDYLGQPMKERFTHVNGSTAVIYGKKAFYTVTNVIVITAATNATTVDLGTGYRLGLPYKGDVEWAKESGVFVPVSKRNIYRWAHFSDADATAGRSHFIYAEFPGYVNTLLGVPHGGGSTNDPVVTVELGGTAITGLTVTIDTSNAAGLTVTDTPTTAGYNANNRFVKGGVIEIVSAAAASAGAHDVGLLLTPTQYTLPVETDPATVSTGDPRGTYEPLTTMDGSLEIVVGLDADDSVNSDGNGGLHGIQHYYA